MYGHLFSGHKYLQMVPYDPVFSACYKQFIVKRKHLYFFFISTYIVYTEVRGQGHTITYLNNCIWSYQFSNTCTVYVIEREILVNNMRMIVNLMLQSTLSGHSTPRPSPCLRRRESRTERRAWLDKNCNHDDNKSLVDSQSDSDDEYGATAKRKPPKGRRNSTTNNYR